MDWIDKTISPVPAEARESLRLALALAISPDAVTMLKDVARLDAEQTRRVLKSAARPCFAPPSSSTASQRGQVPRQVSDHDPPATAVLDIATGSQRSGQVLFRAVVVDVRCNVYRTAARRRGSGTRGLQRGIGNHERAVERDETTDQLRTKTADLSAPQRSTMDTSDK